MVFQKSYENLALIATFFQFAHQMLTLCKRNNGMLPFWAKNPDSEKHFSGSLLRLFKSSPSVLAASALSRTQGLGDA
jgi:hypothetical protein